MVRLGIACPKTLKFGESAVTDARDILFTPTLGLGFVQAEEHE